MKRKAFSFLISLVVVLQMVCSNSPLSLHAAEINRDKMIINVVFDDSGSMIDEYGSWSQAKYSMEVFASMLNQADEMNIFPMSYESNGAYEKYIQIPGSDSPQARIDKITEMNGYKGKYGDTPFETVKNAAQNLVKAQGDKKWLIILTDGAFNDGKIDPSEVTNTIESYCGKDGIKVAFVAIGGNAQNIEINSPDFYGYKAKSDSILSTITDVARNVFSLQKVNITSGDPCKFNVDIPVSRLIFFAQGNTAEISDIKENGKSISGKPVSGDVKIDSSTPIPEKNNVSKEDVIIADNLKGEVMMFDSVSSDKPFPSGDYSFKCQADTIEVYVEPGIEFRTALESTGEVKKIYDPSQTSEIPSGDYNLKIEMYNPLTGEPIDPSSSSLLDGMNVSLDIKDANGDVVSYQNGEKVSLKPGETVFRTIAEFPGGVTQISEGRKIKIETEGLQVLFSQPSGYTLDPSSLESDNPIEVSIISGSGGALSSESYKNCEIQITGTPGIAWTVEPSDKPGVYRLNPSFEGTQGMSGLTESKMNLQAAAKITTPVYTIEGSGTVPLVLAVSEPIGLKLDITTPDELYSDENGYTYMFNPDDTGEDSKQYLTVKVQAENKDGSYRNLSEEEWNQGVDGFSYKASTVHPDAYRWLVKFFCGQKLNFKAVKGDEVSTYRLYLTGNPVNILPNRSKLTITLTISLPSGIRETGNGETEVSVLPLPFWVYLMWILLILAILAILGIIYYVEFVFKKRFKFGSKIHITFEEVDRNEQVTVSEKVIKIKRKNLFNPFVPEECSFRLASDGFDLLTTVRMKAGPKHTIIIENRGFREARDYGLFGHNKDDLGNKSEVQGNYGVRSYVTKTDRLRTTCTAKFSVQADRNIHRRKSKQNVRSHSRSGKSPGRNAGRSRRH